MESRTAPGTIKEVAARLRETVDRAARRLDAIPASLAGKPVSPGKWSPAEIIGHLVDSASNNHSRFVRAQLTDDLTFAGYDQEAWVRLQEYCSADWSSLVALWRGYNLHLAHVIERIPDEVLVKPRERHNLDEIAWKTIPREAPVTLDYFIRDYVAHLEHHLSQIPE